MIRVQCLNTTDRSSADADRDAQEAAARAHPKIAQWLRGKTVVRVVAVPGRTVNFVVR